MPRFHKVPSAFKLERFRDLEVEVVSRMLRVRPEQVVSALRAQEERGEIPDEVARYYIMNGDDPVACAEKLREMYYSSWPLHIIGTPEDVPGTSS